MPDCPNYFGEIDSPDLDPKRIVAESAAEKRRELQPIPIKSPRKPRAARRVEQIYVPKVGVGQVQEQLLPAMISKECFVERDDTEGTRLNNYTLRRIDEELTPILGKPDMLSHRAKQILSEGHSGRILGTATYADIVLLGLLASNVSGGSFEVVGGAKRTCRWKLPYWTVPNAVYLPVGADQPPTRYCVTAYDHSLRECDVRNFGTGRLERGRPMLEMGVSINEIWGRPNELIRENIIATVLCRRYLKMDSGQILAREGNIVISELINNGVPDASYFGIVRSLSELVGMV